jgi:hypothetical protein
MIFVGLDALGVFIIKTFLCGILPFIRFLFKQRTMKILQIVFEVFEDNKTMIKDLELQITMLFIYIYMPKLLHKYTSIFYQIYLMLYIYSCMVCVYISKYIFMMSCIYVF